MSWLLAGVALVGLVQAVVWIGQPSAPAGRRLLGVFAAPVALLLLLVTLAATRIPGLLFE
jgi:hypothetical protein